MLLHRTVCCFLGWCQVPSIYSSSSLDLPCLFHEKLKISFSSSMEHCVGTFDGNEIYSIFLMILSSISYISIYLYVFKFSLLFFRNLIIFDMRNILLLLDWLILSSYFPFGSLEFWHVPGRWCWYHQHLVKLFGRWVSNELP